MTPWTVACQAPLPTGFPRQEYWSGLPFPSPGDLQLTDRTQVSCIGRWILYCWDIREALLCTWFSSKLPHPFFFNPLKGSECFTLTLFPFTDEKTKIQITGKETKFLPLVKTRTLTQMCSISKHSVFSIKLFYPEDTLNTIPAPQELSLMGKTSKKSDH